MLVREDIERIIEYVDEICTNTYSYYSGIRESHKAEIVEEILRRMNNA